MKRIQSIVTAKETLELEKAVAKELQETNEKEEKAIASLLLVDDQREETSEDSKGIHDPTSV